MSWSRTQGISFQDDSATTHASITATFGSNLTNPSLIILGITYDNGTGFPNVKSVTDTAGNVYVRVPSLNFSDLPNGQATEVWIAPNKSTTASNVVTITFFTAAAFAGFVGDEFIGMAGGNVVDVSAVQVSSPTSPGPFLSPAVIPLQNNELIYGFLSIDGNTATPPITANSPFTIGTVTATAAPIGSEYFSQSSAASIQATFNLTESSPVFGIVSILTIATVAIDDYQVTPVVRYPDSVICVW